LKTADLKHQLSASSLSGTRISLGGNHIAVKGPVMLTIEICRQVLHHPVYFCDGATTPLLGYDVVSAASLVIDTEARQVWSKNTVQHGHAKQFTPPATEPSTATNPATVRRSSTAASTIVNSTATNPSTVYNASTTASSSAINPSSVRCSSATTSTTADPSTTTPSAAGRLTAALLAATASTTRDTSTTPLETVQELRVITLPVDYH